MITITCSCNNNNNTLYFYTKIQSTGSVQYGHIVKSKYNIIQVNKIGICISKSKTN